MRQQRVLLTLENKIGRIAELTLLDDPFDGVKTQWVRHNFRWGRPKVPINDYRLCYSEVCRCFSFSLQHVIRLFLSDSRCHPDAECDRAGT
jgi:hypothetical protein